MARERRLLPRILREHREKLPRRLVEALIDDPVGGLEIRYLQPDLRANPDGLLARRSFMNVAAMTAPKSLLEEAEASTLYSVCFFERDWIVPEVQFLEAENDSDALVFARSMRPGMTREIWDRIAPSASCRPAGSSAALERRFPAAFGKIISGLE